MVSFGHAAYLGIGGYAVGILAQEASAPASCSGRSRSSPRRCSRSASARSRLRTRGVYFIMITLAFAQMVYYVGVGLDRYGGDDGLHHLPAQPVRRPDQSSNRTLFYYLCFALLLATVYLRLAAS